jgi:thiamine-monophosphate kinase
LVDDPTNGLSAEERLIARYFRPLATAPGAFTLSDDAAALTPPDGSDLVVTTDGIIAGVHVFADDPAEVIACKALRVNLSDLAAKGAKPAGFVMALALPKDISEGWLAAFAAGLGADAESYGCPLLGGDTDRTPGPLSVSITAFGHVPRGGMIRRNGATVGDRVFVTGTIGDAALGLQVRKDEALAERWRLDPAAQKHLLARYRLPQPRNAIAEALRATVSAAMDVSDGLAGDLGKLTRASGVSAEIDVARVPLSAAGRAVLAADPAQIEAILTGGDDYEILATLSPDKVEPFRRACAAARVPATEIGQIVSGEAAPRFLGPEGKPLTFARPSFSHF